MRLHLPVVIVALCQIAAAQASPATRDSASRDTAPPPVRDNYGILLVMALMGVAPASPFFIKSIREQQASDTGSLVPDRYVIAHAAVGYAGDHDTAGWGLSQDVQAFWRHAFGELRVQDLHARTLIEVRTLTVGYLARVPNNLAGLTLGYRHANRADIPDAWEIGLPLVGSAKAGILRVAAVYAISARGVSWNYRWDASVFVPRSPFVVSLDFDFKPLRQGGPYYTTMLLGLGLRR